MQKHRFNTVERKLLVIHCAATKPNQDWGVEEIRNIHVNEKKYDDVGYQKIIKRNGLVQRGRPDHIQPAAHAPWNKNSIAICLIGGIDENNQPDNNFTIEQMVSLRAEVEDYKRKYDIVTICGHRDLPRARFSDDRVAKACPCFHVLEWVYTEIIMK